MRLCHMRDYLYKFRIVLISVKSGKNQVSLILFLYCLRLLLTRRSSLHSMKAPNAGRA